MRNTQLIAIGIDETLAERLQALVQPRGVWLREVQNAKAALNLARQAEGVILIKLGRDLEKEFTLLDQVTRWFPRLAPLVLSDVDHPHLAGLAWDLGARFVLFPPRGQELLNDVIVRLLPD